VAVRFLEHRRHLAVEAQPLDRIQVAVERRADERVLEAEPPDRPQHLLDETALRRRGQRGEETVGGEPRQACQQDHREFPAEDGGHREDRLTVGGQAPEAASDRLAEPLGEVVDRRVLARAGEVVDHLADEERIAAALAMDAPDERDVGRVADRGFHEPMDVVLAQAAEVEPLVVRLASELGQRLDERMGRAELVRAVRREEEEGGVADFPGEELEEEERGRIRPVEILQDEHERVVVGATAEHLADGVEDPEPGVGRGERRLRRRLGEVGDDLADLGNDP
jgi:hypothetical protein